MSGLYAYGVVDAERVADTAGRIGDDLTTIAVDRVAAVVRAVEVSDYEGEALERNVADSGWLERSVREHAAVVEQLSAALDVIPMRFGSIFSDQASLVRMLTESQADLVRLLNRIRGRVELGLKLQVNRQDVAAQLSPALEGSASGRDYLRLRQAQLKLAEQVDEVIAQLASEVHKELGALADEAVSLRPGSGQVPLTLSAAYLVRRDDVPRFLDRAGELGREHRECSVEITGPWAPYSFCSVDVAGAHR